MKHPTQILPVLIFCVLIAASPLAAQEQEDNQVVQKSYRATDQFDVNQSTDYVSQPMYDKLVQQAIKTRSNEFEFGLFRSLYPQTRQYDPLGEEISHDIVGLAYEVENAQDVEKRKTALEEYKRLVTEHLANIDVVSQALSLSRNNQVYGDPSFFEWMRAGLLRDVLGSGTGDSLAGGYDIITLGEETALLNALRLRVLQTDARHAGRLWYNMHLVKDAKHPQPYWIFVDITSPMKAIEAYKNNQSQPLSLRNE